MGRRVEQQAPQEGGFDILEWKKKIFLQVKPNNFGIIPQNNISDKSREISGNRLVFSPPEYI